MEINLTDKVALVTGGSRGIGRAVCLAFGRAGAHVIVNYVKSTESAQEVVDAIKSAGGAAEAIQADVSSPEEVEALFAVIRKQHPRLDILVNNAGVIKDMLLLGMTVKDWDRVMDINLKSAFLCSTHAAEMMMANHSGVIVNMSSTSAIMGSRGQCNYAAAKGGLISFTRTSAVELAGKGIRVNAVLPGMVVTDMSKRARKRAGEQLLGRIPQGRYGEPEEIANLVTFLASDKSAYITGQAIVIDGGLSSS